MSDKGEESVENNGLTKIRVRIIKRVVRGRHESKIRKNANLSVP